MEVPVTLRTSRKKAILGLMGCVVFIAIALSMDHSLFADIGIAFFGLGAIVFTMQLLPNSSYLRLTREGFTMCSLFRCHTIQWRHVSGFGVGRIYTKKVVGWDPAHDVSKPGKVTKALSGFASALPDTYGLGAEELAALMNRLRDEYAAPST